MFFLFITFKRLNKVLENIIFLEQNSLNKNILVVIDRADNEKDLNTQFSYIKKLKNHNVKVIHRSRNNGLFKNITSSINYAFKYYRCNNLIVIEDDVLLNKGHVYLLEQKIDNNNVIGKILTPYFYNDKNSHQMLNYCQLFSSWGFSISEKRWREFKKLSFNLYLKDTLKCLNSSMIWNFFVLGIYLRLKFGLIKSWAYPFFFFCMSKKYRFLSLNKDQIFITDEDSLNCDPQKYSPIRIEISPNLKEQCLIYLKFHNYSKFTCFKLFFLAPVSLVRNIYINSKLK